MKKILYLLFFMISSSYAGPMPGVNFGGLLLGAIFLLVGIPILFTLSSAGGIKLIINFTKHLAFLIEKKKYFSLSGHVFFIYFLIKIWFFSWFLGLYITLWWYMMLYFLTKEKKKTLTLKYEVSFNNMLIQHKFKK